MQPGDHEVTQKNSFVTLNFKNFSMQNISSFKSPVYPLFSNPPNSSFHSITSFLSEKGKYTWEYIENYIIR